MGYIRHNVIIVTGDSYEQAQVKFDSVHKKAAELFGSLVTNPIRSYVNGYQTFFIAPDGSKEGWDESNVYDESRKKLANYIDSLAYGDGSNCVNFVDLGYDEYLEAKIDRTNKEVPDED